jgi:hypothetical protein
MDRALEQRVYKPTFLLLLLLLHHLQALFVLKSLEKRFLWDQKESISTVMVRLPEKVVGAGRLLWRLSSSKNIGDKS